VALAVPGACTQVPEQEAQEEGSRADPTPVEGIREAVYHTGLTFVGFRPQPLIVHLRLDNRTSPGALNLDYRAWLSAETDWNPILDRRDSLPVPRAAWRIVPSGPLRIQVGEGADLTALVMQGPEGEIRVAAGGEIAAWNSATGQRETLRLAEAGGGDGGQPGLLLARQRARLVSEPPLRALSQYFLLTDTIGNGLFVLRDGVAPDAPATAWTWFDMHESEWPDAAVLALAAPAGSPGRWSLELPQADAFGEIQGESAGPGELPEEGAGFRIFRVTGMLVLDGARMPMAGVGVEERGP
jgi:hypothetical protein